MRNSNQVQQLSLIPMSEVRGDRLPRSDTK